MRHLTHIDRIAEAIADHRLCLFYIKAPDCGVCNVMLDKVGRMAEHHPLLDAFYTDIIEEPLIAGRFLVYSGPTVLLLFDGKEVYRASGFIDVSDLVDERTDELAQVEEVGGMNLYTVETCLFRTTGSIAEQSHNSLHLLRSQLIHRPINDGGMPYCCLKIRLKWVRLSESKSKLACIWPNVSIFAVFRRQRYDDSVKPAFLFSSAFLPISFKISFNDAEANLNCYFTTR